MKHTARRSPDIDDATLHARGIGDGDLIAFLKHARRRLARAGAEAAPGWASALATLELEAARRGLRLQGVRERIPIPIAHHRLELAIEEGDPVGVGRLLRYLDGRGHWRAYRYALSLSSAEDTAYLLERIHWHMNVRLFGVPVARLRRRRASQSLRRLDSPRRAARLRRVLAFMFQKYYGLSEHGHR